MRVIFAGTPAFALPTLDALVSAGHSIAAVYTQPDRAAGRGQRIARSPVKEYALTRDIPVKQPTTLRGSADEIAHLRADAMVVVAYGLILPPDVLRIPHLGCLNVHASLLPRWRGAAPIARAIEAGDAETGISIMLMEPGLDTGPVLATAREPIRSTDTAAALEARLARLGGNLLVPTLDRYVRGELRSQPQDSNRACYAPKLQKGESPIDWNEGAVVLHRRIRAMNPWPVASTVFRGNVLRVWEVGELDLTRQVDAAPGEIMRADAEGIWVQTGKGLLSLTRLQSAGGKVLSAREFANGTRLSASECFGA